MIKILKHMGYLSKKEWEFRNDINNKLIFLRQLHSSPLSTHLLFGKIAFVLPLNEVLSQPMYSISCLLSYKFLITSMHKIRSIHKTFNFEFGQFYSIVYF